MGRRYSSTELGMGYGIIAGGAVGVLLMAVTGNAVWLGISSALGLLVGMIAGQLGDQRSGEDQADDSVQPSEAKGGADETQR